MIGDMVDKLCQARLVRVRPYSVCTGGRFWADFLARYEVKGAGGQEHLKYWIPAEDLPAFNAAIIGEIELVAQLPAPRPQLTAGVSRMGH
jgi:hypothetical protein